MYSRHVMEKFIQDLDLSGKGVWFPIILGVISFLFIIFMPKRLSWTEIYITFCVGGFFAVVLDVIVMGSQLYLFDIASRHKEGLADIMSYAVAAPCYAVIFLNYYKQDKKWLYVIIFTILSVVSEWIFVKIGFMKLKGWQTWWSIPVYVAVYGLWLPWHLNLMRRRTNESS